MGLLKAERSRAGLGGHELERPTRNVADPQRPHKLEGQAAFLNSLCAIPAAAGY